jgi:chemotaxis protein MotB
MPDKQQPIVLIRKRKPHGNGHHGGAWKVAYADFVTALMALFIVLWLTTATPKRTQQIIAGYFRDPNGSAAQQGSDQQGTGENILLKQQDMNKLRQALLQSIHRIDNLDRLKKQIEMTITPEGLRIELLESPKGTFFETGSTQPTPILVELLKILSQQIGPLPNHISIEGHTDSQPYAKPGIYSNWELSSDRANVARRLMQNSGIRQDQVSQVRGFADERLRNPKNPLDPANRRISLIVQYLNAKDDMPMAPQIPGVQSVATVAKPPAGVLSAAPLMKGK